MKRIKIPLFLGCFFAFSYALTAAQVFILFDNSCMDRLEFDYTRADAPGQYVAYNINIKSGQRLVLEVGLDPGRASTFVPAPVLGCGSGGFDQSLMRRINSNIDEIFMVFPTGDQQFVITQVLTASFYEKAGNVISYDSPKYSFRFNSQYGTIGENIAVNNPGAKVYFEGRMENDCTGAYLFRQLTPQSAFPLIDLVVIPEIGVVEERSGANAAAAMNNALTLRNVNGQPLDRYLPLVCGTEPGSLGSVVKSVQPSQVPAGYENVTAYNPIPGNLPKGAIIAGGTPAANPPAATTVAPANSGLPANAIVAVPAAQPTSFVPNAATNPQPAPATTGTHTVASGETLYGIAKKYNASVDNIKAWNNMSSNTIRRGQVLQVAAPTAAAPATTPVTAAVVPKGNFSPYNTANGTTLSGAPVPYDNATTQQRISTTDTNPVHIVQPGETVASVALLYGFTAQKFRDINGLKNNDVLKVGQRLKTSDCNCPATIGQVNTPSSASTSSPAAVPPTSYNNFSDGRIVTESTSLTARTPVAAANTSPVFAPNPQVPVNNSSGLATALPYSAPSVPSVNSRTPSDYDKVVPVSFENNTSRSVNSVENGRAIGSGTDFGSPVASANRSPLPAPNAPISYGANNTPAATAAAPATKPANQRRVHIVTSGESLYGIAKRYGTTTERLRQLNQLGPNDPIMEYQSLYLD